MAVSASLATLRDQLPLPLARLADRYLQSKTPLERLYAAFYVWEASLNLLASVALIEFAALRQPRAELEDSLTTLSRPKTSDWWRILRELTAVLSQAGNKEFQEIERDLLESVHRDLPRAAGLESTLKDVENSEEGKHSQATVTLASLFDRLVVFRNTMAHKAFVMQPAERHDEIARILADGMVDILRRINVLAGRQLVWVRDVKQSPSGNWLVDRWALTGVEPKQLEPIEFPRNATEELPRTQWLYLHPASMDLGDPRGLAPDRLLQPLMFFDHEWGDVFFLSTAKEKKRVILFCYSIGEQQRQELLDDQCEFLQRLLGKPISRQQVNELAAKRLAKETKPETPAPDEPVEPESQWLGEFQLLKVIGYGAMGVVYRAWQPMMGREVALKRLKGGGDDTRARFRNEISALGRVVHPNVVKIYQYGAAGIDEFYTMELLPGADLGRVLRHLCLGAESQVNDGQDTIGIDASTWDRAMSTAIEEARGEEKPLSSRGSGSDAKGPSASAAFEALSLPVHPSTNFHGSKEYLKRVADICSQIALGLHALHEQGVYHRDVKPSNIMVTPDGTAVLTDLGLARVQMEESQNLTTEHFLGTVRYASPEQAISPKEVDGRSDVYSLGVTLWELLTFRSFKDITPTTPFPQAAALLLQEADPVRKYARHVPRDLEAIVMKCLDRDRSKRYDTAKELAEHLSLWQRGEVVPLVAPSLGELTKRWLRKHWRVAGLAAAAALMVVLMATAMVMGYFLRKLNTANADLEKLSDELRGHALMLASEKAHDYEVVADWPGALLWYANAARLADPDELADVRRQLLSKVSDTLPHYPYPVNAWTTPQEIRQLRIVETPAGAQLVTVDAAGQALVGDLFQRLELLDKNAVAGTLTCVSQSGGFLAAIRGGDVRLWTVASKTAVDGQIPDGFRVTRAAVDDDGSIVVVGQTDVGKVTTAFLGTQADGAIAFAAVTNGLIREFTPPRTPMARTTLISPDGAFLLGANDAGAPVRVWRFDRTLVDPARSEALSEDFEEEDPETAPASGGAEISGERMIAVEHALGRKRDAYPTVRQIAVSADGGTIAAAGAFTSLWICESTEELKDETAPDSGAAVGRIVIPTDVDFWEFRAPADGRVVVEMEAVNDQGDRLDSAVALFVDDFQQLVENDDAANRGLDSRLEASVVAGQKYLLRARSMQDSVGRYRLRVMASAADGASGAGPAEEALVLTRPSVWHEMRRQSDRPSTSVTFSEDGSRVLVCYDEGLPVLWCVNSDNVDVTLQHEGARSGAFSADGRWVATVGGDGVRVWSVATGAPLTPLLASGRTPMLAAFDPSGRWLVVASEYEAAAPAGRIGASFDATQTRYEMTAWDLRCGEEGFLRMALPAHADAIVPSPTGDVFLITERDGAASLVNGDGVAAREDFERFAFDERRAGAALATALASSSRGSEVRYDWRSESPSLLARWRRDPAGGRSHPGLRPLAAFSPDGSHLALKQSDHVVVACDLRAAVGQAVMARDFGDRTIEDFAWTRDGSLLAVILAGGAEVGIWDLSAAEPVMITTNLRVRDASFSADGRWIVLSGDRGLEMWSLENAEPERINEMFDPSRGLPVFAARFLPDRTKLIIVQAAVDDSDDVDGVATSRTDSSDWLTGFGCEIRQWDLKGPYKRLIRGPQLIDGVTFSLDGAARFVAWTGNVATCWSFDGKPPIELVHTEKVEHAAVSLGGMRLVTWSPRGLIRVWDTATGDEVQLPVIAPGSVQHAGVAPNGDLWAVWNQTRLIRWPRRRAPVSDAAVVRSLVERRFGLEVDDEMAVLRPKPYAPDARDATTGRDEDENWLRRQIFDCIAARDWDAALDHLERLNASVGAEAVTPHELIVRAKARLASGQTAAAVGDCDEAIARAELPADQERCLFFQGLVRFSTSAHQDAVAVVKKCPGVAAYQRAILDLLGSPSTSDCWPIAASLLAPESPFVDVWRGELRPLDFNAKESVTGRLCEFATSAEFPLTTRQRALALLPAYHPINQDTFAALEAILIDGPTPLGQQIPVELRSGMAEKASFMEPNLERRDALLRLLASDDDPRVSAAARQVQQQLRQPSAEQPQFEQRRTGK